jgi:hypothetical protein
MPHLSESLFLIMGQLIWKSWSKIYCEFLLSHPYPDRRRRRSTACSSWASRACRTCRRRRPAESCRCPAQIGPGAWVRCYNHNFLRFSTFSAKKMAVFSKTSIMNKFLHNLALFWVENTCFFHRFFYENTFKIMTSVPGVRIRKYIFIYIFVTFMNGYQGG